MAHPKGRRWSRTSDPSSRCANDRCDERTRDPTRLALVQRSLRRRRSRMTIHVLVEGPSERAFLDHWAPRLLPGYVVRVHPHQGKGALPGTIQARPNPKMRGLLDQLPAKLRGFAEALNPHADAVLVLLDADNDDVTALRDSILAVVQACAPQLPVRISIAVEETEAFYLGDLRALQHAYPAANMGTARAYIPDSICGTWELFGQIVGDDGGNKVAWAEAMGPQITTQPAQSRSMSFRALINSLQALLPAPAAPQQPRRYRHPPRVRRRNNGLR